MGRITNKNRRRKELEKHVATQAANKKMLDDSLARRDKEWERKERILELANPPPGARKVSSGVLNATRKHARA